MSQRVSFYPLNNTNMHFPSSGLAVPFLWLRAFLLERYLSNNKVFIHSLHKSDIYQVQ
jgi:hypothetical protein